MGLAMTHQIVRPFHTMTRPGQRGPGGRARPYPQCLQGHARLPSVDAPAAKRLELLERVGIAKLPISR